MSASPRRSSGSRAPRDSRLLPAPGASSAAKRRAEAVQNVRDQVDDLLSDFSTRFAQSQARAKQDRQTFLRDNAREVSQLARDVARFLDSTERSRADAWNRTSSALNQFLSGVGREVRAIRSEARNEVAQNRRDRERGSQQDAAARRRAVRGIASRTNDLLDQAAAMHERFRKQRQMTGARARHARIEANRALANDVEQLLSDLNAERARNADAMSESLTQFLQDLRREVGIILSGDQRPASGASWASPRVAPARVAPARATRVAPARARRGARSGSPVNDLVSASTTANAGTTTTQTSSATSQANSGAGTQPASSPPSTPGSATANTPPAPPPRFRKRNVTLEW
ncbi:MAG: hypothetical protein SFZ23_01115 [Planctomycetota bacterium]|nr:hypothetical protein [Planctomycetota bacterium]